MKKYISLIIIIISLASCKKQLATAPTDTLAPETYYNTEDDLNKALTGVYNSVANNNIYGLFFAYWHHYNADELYAVAGASGNAINAQSATDANYQAFWQACYQGIYRANVLLENLNKPAMDETKRNAIKGETLFLRGYFYYLLATHYGGVPMPLKSGFDIDNPGLPRSSLKEVYTQILADMTAAEPLVYKISAFTTNGRVTQTAVQGILARVSLSMAGFPLNETARYNDALQWATKVYTSGLHALNPDYTKVFINLMQDVYDTKENLWEIEFEVKSAPTAYTGGGRWGNVVGLVSNDNAIGITTNFSACTGKLFFSYTDTNDVRLNWNCANFTYTGVSSGATKVPLLYTQNQYNRQIGKFRREYELTVPKQKNLTPCNFPAIRYSDVLLMLAEAENEVNGPTPLALTCLNLVRTRAKATNFTYTGTGSFVITSKAAFRSTIQDERLRELCYETQRRLDLIRWGIYIPTMKALSLDFATNAPTNTTGRLAGDNTSERNYYYPIPQYELGLNPLLTQNPGF
jgi:hypothetical protein